MHVIKLLKLCHFLYAYTSILHVYMHADASISVLAVNVLHALVIVNMPIKLT